MVLKNILALENTSSNNKTLNARLLETQVCHRSYIIAARKYQPEFVLN
jgi:hypothetical protein